ncbi:MAG: rhomboid family intramembrane serine protease [Micromonosporaceae bacterium]|jgi:membrane associated rhomboid family serine protease
MEGLSRPDDAPLRFGTEAFYASLGRAFVVMCGVVPVLFLVWALDWALPGVSLVAAGGIQPRNPDGLDGILFAPLLHASFTHLVSNSVPLILLGTFVLAAGVRRFLWSTVLIMLVSGLGVWLIGSPGTVHVGASGVIFGYLGLLLTRGLVEQSWWNAAVALLIGLLYWWQLAGMLPGQESVSWEGHLLGFAGGVLAAVLFRWRRRPVRRAPDDTLPDFTLPG